MAGHEKFEAEAARWDFPVFLFTAKG